MVTGIGFVGTLTGGEVRGTSGGVGGAGEIADAATRESRESADDAGRMGSGAVAFAAVDVDAVVADDDAPTGVNGAAATSAGDPFGAVMIGRDGTRADNIESL